MKAAKLTLIMCVLTCAILISGCQECQKASDDCLNAYDQNREMYDYVGGMPEECKD